jgi:hypothetical protein
MKAGLALIAPLALAACATALPASMPAPEGSAVALGQPVTVGDLVVTAQKVVTDSRCPINARCVWAGELIVRVRIQAADWRETDTLTLGEPYATHGVSITLASGEPGRMAGADEPAPGDYRFTFE